MQRKSVMATSLATLSGEDSYDVSERDFVRESGEAAEIAADAAADDAGEET